jgi:hypothetical protein
MRKKFTYKLYFLSVKLEGSKKWNFLTKCKIAGKSEEANPGT